MGGRGRYVHPGIGRLYTLYVLREFKINKKKKP